MEAATWKETGYPEGKILVGGVYELDVGRKVNVSMGRKFRGGIMRGGS